MKTALDVDVSKLDTSENNFIQNVQTHGWALTHVLADDQRAGFSYTTGFWHKFKVPELLIFSLPQEVSHQILWNYFNDLEEGKRIVEDVPVSDVLEGYEVIFKPISETEYSGYLGWNRWFYLGDHFQAQQMFYPNMAGSFPWDADASTEFRVSQPNLSASI